MKGLDASRLNWCRLLQTLYPRVKPNWDKAILFLPGEMILVNFCHFLKKKFHHFPIKCNCLEESLVGRGEMQRSPREERLIFFWKPHNATRWARLRLRADLIITVKFNCHTQPRLNANTHTHKYYYIILYTWVYVSAGETFTLSNDEGILLWSCCHTVTRKKKDPPMGRWLLWHI